MNKVKIFEEAHQQIQLPKGISEQNKHHYDDWLKYTELPAIYKYEVSNAYVSPYGLAFKNGRLIKEVLYDMYAKSATPYTFYKKIILRKVKTVADTCVLFHHGYYDNYYHWYTECLPRLFVLREQLKDALIILPKKLKKFHLETLQWFELKGIVYCEPDEIIKAKKLLFSNFTAKHFGTHRQEVLKEMVAYIKSKIKIQEINVPNIYTPRSSAPKRNCVNEAEVLAILKEYGFESILMDDLTQEQQISMFINAKNVAGVHGSSFVNLMYMKQGRIIDFMEKRHCDLCYSNMATIFNQEYYVQESEGAGNHTDFRDDDIIVDTNLLSKLFNS
jgi:capsular polysaccharide biosynthesis protein